jgi:hypothetical protein
MATIGPVGFTAKNAARRNAVAAVEDDLETPTFFSGE